MKCQAHVAVRDYSPAGPCQITRGVRLVRWAPTPLTTMVRRLCTSHRKVLENGGKLSIMPQKFVAVGCNEIGDATEPAL